MKFQILLAGMLFLTACGSKPLAEIKVPFTGESVMNVIAGEPYRFFRYETKEAAQADIAKVSSDGHAISGRRIPWEGPVHFYFKLKRIVIYVGSNPVVTKTIEDVFGPQTAGDPLPPQGERAG